MHDAERVMTEAGAALIGNVNLLVGRRADGGIVVVWRSAAIAGSAADEPDAATTPMADSLRADLFRAAARYLLLLDQPDGDVPLLPAIAPNGRHMWIGGSRP